MAKIWYSYNLSSGYHSVGNFVEQETKPEPVRERISGQVVRDWTDVPIPQMKRIPEGASVHHEIRWNFDTNSWSDRHIIRQYQEGNVPVYVKAENGVFRVVNNWRGAIEDIPNSVEQEFFAFPEQLDQDTILFAHSLADGIARIIEIDSGVPVANHGHNLEMLNIVDMFNAGGAEVKSEHRQRLLDDENYETKTNTLITHETAGSKITNALMRWRETHSKLKGHGTRIHHANRELAKLQGKSGRNLVSQFNTFYSEISSRLSPQYGQLLRALNLYMRGLKDSAESVLGSVNITSADYPSIIAIRNSLQMPTGQAGVDYHILPKHLRNRD